LSPKFNHHSLQTLPIIDDATQSIDRAFVLTSFADILNEHTQ